MDLLSVIRRWHGQDKLPIREIARRIGLSLDTLRKCLASGVTEPKYPPRKSPSKLDAYAETLSSWLKHEPRRPCKWRRNLKQLYHDLAALGYGGTYDWGHSVAVVANRLGLSMHSLYAWEKKFGPDAAEH